MTILTDLGIREIRDGVRAGEFSAREVADAFIVAVSRAKPLNAFLVETPDHAIAAANAADAARAAGNAGTLQALLLAALMLADDLADAQSGEKRPPEEATALVAIAEKLEALATRLEKKPATS